MKRSSIRILIVEDEYITARAIAEQLTSLGYTVIGIASRGDEAIQIVAEHKPNLVLMDIVLKPGPYDGIEAATLIWRNHHIPVIYLTANSDWSTVDRAKHAQVYGFIIKPFNEQVLQASIETALYKHQQERAHLTEMVSNIEIYQDKIDLPLFTPKVMDIDEFCENLISNLQSSMNLSTLQFINQNIQPVIPELDPILLEVILSELLLNAIKYSFPDGLVSLIFFCSGQHAVFQVIDQGIGIPEQDQRHLFEPLFRGSNVNSIQGYGLGLSKVKYYVQAHQGQISVSSAEGIGSTFQVMLPLP